MPVRPKIVCGIAGCTRAVAKGQCDCGKAASRKRGRDYRPSPSRRGYDHQWRKVRDAVLRDEPLCRFCADNGITMPANEVDHIVPIAEGGERLDRANLRPLCKPCHSRHTALTRGFARPALPAKI